MLTCFPAPEVAKEIPVFQGADKLVHAIMFGGVVAALVFDTCRRAPDSLTRAHTIVFFVIAVILGVATEIVQAVADVSRSGDFYDFLADCIGAYVAFLIAPGVCRAIFRQSSL